jgi:hypothetical protein
MEIPFKFYIHGLVTKFETDFDTFLKSSKKQLLLRSDDKPYLHTIYMYFRDALEITIEDYTTTIFHNSVPKMGDDLIPEILKNSGMNFKVSIVRDKNESPPLVTMSFIKLY